MSERVGIALATRNNAPFIGGLIASILAQSHRDISVTVRDDGSSDGTFEIVCEQAKRDSRITILPDRTPSGSAQANFFAILDAIDADYIMFADADDIWLPDKVRLTLEKMKELEDKHGTQTPILVHGDLCVVDRQLSTIAESMFDYEKISPERDSLTELIVQNNVTGCTIMINRALRELVPTRPSECVMHDWWFALAASAFGKTGVIYRQLILYRQHAGNQVGAYRASNLAASLKRLTARGRTRAIYDSMFRQAGCFADYYRDKLSENQLELLEAFASMNGMNKLQKLRTINRYKFHKNTFLRNLGQLLAI